MVRVKVGLFSCISLSTHSLSLHLSQLLKSIPQAPATIQLLSLYFLLHHLVSSCILDSNLSQIHQGIRICLLFGCKQNQHYNGRNLRPIFVGNMMRSIGRMLCISNSHYFSKSNCPCMCILIGQSLLLSSSMSRMMYTMTMMCNLYNRTSFIHM